MAAATLCKYTLAAHAFRGRRSLDRRQTTANDSLVMSYKQRAQDENIAFVSERVA